MQVNASHTRSCRLRAVAAHSGNSLLCALAGVGQPPRPVVGLPTAAALGSAGSAAAHAFPDSNPALQRTAFGTR